MPKYSHAFLQPTPRKEKVKKDDISLSLLDGKQMLLFANSLSSTDGDNIESQGNVFGVTNFGIFSSDKLHARKSKSIFQIQDNVRMRTNDGIVLYAKQFEKDGDVININESQAFLYDNSTILSKKINKISDSIYEIDNMTFSACELNGSYEVEDERLRCSKDYKDSQNILSPVNLNTIQNDNTYENVKKQYDLLPWSITADKVRLDTDTQYMTAKNLKVNVFSMPVFKINQYTQKIDGSARSGFLPPSLVFLGSRQIGLSIPYYLRLKNNIDLKLTPTFYQNLNGITGKELPAGSTSTMDAQRLRANTLDIQYRHLFYEEDEENNIEEGKLTIDTLVTDKTGLISSTTRQYEKDINNNILYGNRWHIDSELKLGITNNTYIKGELKKSSDPNILPIYRLKYDFYARNYLGIYNSTKDYHNVAEIIRFDPLLIYTPSATRPIVMPHLRSVFEKQIDNIIGGRVLIDQRYVDLKRTSGYSSKIYNAELGYTIPIRTQNGAYFNLFASSKFDHQRSTFKDYSSPNDGYISSFSNTQNVNIYNMQESRMIYNPMLNAQTSNFSQNRKYYNLNLDFSKPFFTGLGNLGQFIIEPRVKYKQSPYMNTASMILEDSLGTQLQYTNLFASNLSDGYGIIDSGKRLSYGVDAYTRFGKTDINALISAGVVNYIGRPNEFYYEYNGGLTRNMSDYVGVVKIYNKFFSLTHDYRVNSRNDFTLISGIARPRFQNTTISITKLGGFDASMSYNKSSLMPYGTLGTMTAISPQISYTFKNNLSIGLRGIRLINSQDGLNNTDMWLSQSLSILKQTNCITYGLLYTQMNYNIPGVSTRPVVKFSYAITGI
ncbi:LPS assembly protein LptD [Candidatus Deianiraea vastatrix]|nr:LPS assembly protein LptD [Candidatus Deianiraea vastatrix]